jgi:hypothetical protein
MLSTNCEEIAARKGVGSPSRTQARKGNGETRRGGILQGVHQGEKFEDAVFSDGPLAWETQGEIAADFFTLPTVTFRLLTCFFVTEHGRRKILHFNGIRHPAAEWVVQQSRETFPEAGPHRYVVFDCDSEFDADVITFLKATGLKPKRTSVRDPWRNGTSERWVGSCRREILDHVIAGNVGAG